MKKAIISVLVITLVIICSLGVFADFYQHRSDRTHRDWPDMNSDARYIIHRTSTIVSSAQQMANIGHQYYQLAQAVGHQQKSIELYKNGLYRDAIFHSLRARNIAFQIIDDNLERLHQDFSPDRTEMFYNHNIPRDEELDRRLNRNQMYKDEDTSRMKFELDLKL